MVLRGAAIRVWTARLPGMRPTANPHRPSRWKLPNKSESNSRERLNAVGVSQAPVLISIPRDRVILKELRYPAVPLPEEPNVVRFQAMKELTDSPEDVILDYVPLSNGSSEGERRSMAVAVRKEFFAAIQALCAAANLKLAAVTPRPFCFAAGLNRAFATGSAPRPENSDPFAILTLSPGGGEFTVIRPGTVSGSNDVTFTRTIPAPSLTSETELLAGVRRNLSMYAGANPGQPIQALYVAEPEGRFVNRLRGALGIPIHAYDPLAGVTSTVPESNHGRFAGAVGLLAANGLGQLPINFVTPRQPKVEKDPKQKQLLLGAGLGALIVLAGLGYGMVMVNDKENELAELQKKKADLEETVTQLEPDNKRLDAANQWLARRVVWLDMLYDISDQIQYTDGMLVKSYTAKAVQPDPRTGKQDGQATVDIKLTAHSYYPVEALMASMDADNTDPKMKYYNIRDKNIAKMAQGDAEAKEYNLPILVNSRPPTQFTRFPSFATPPRWGYPPIVIPPKEQNPRKRKRNRRPHRKKRDGTGKDPKDAPGPKPKLPELDDQE